MKERSHRSLSSYKKPFATQKQPRPYLSFEGVNPRRYQSYMEMELGEEVEINRFISTSLIQAIAEQHADNNEGDFLSIRLSKGTNAFYLSAVNEIPGSAIYGTARQVELIIDDRQGYEVARLDGTTNEANGEDLSDL